jgi:hypothetical protein
VSVLASGSVTRSYVCSFTSNPDSGTNTASATWEGGAAFTPDGSASGTAAYAFGAPTKLVNQTVTVGDSFEGTLGTLIATDSAPFISGTFTYSRTVSGVGGTCTMYDNTATIVETDQTSGQSVKVCVGVDLTVSKTTKPGYTRTYNWHITKNVDKTLVKQVGGTATFTYTVVASETGFTDSSWQVTGTITVTNPNDWEVITANVADTIDNGGTCAVSGGSNVSVPAGKSITLNYLCMFTSDPGSGTNTATVTWNSGTFFTPDGAATGTAPYAFGAPTKLVNQTITVTDTFYGVTTTLGEITATDTTPFASGTFTYARVISIPPFGCVTYPNTAKIVQTSQTASASVKVCGPVRTGALTMGFWQNKNGQGIIAGANQPALLAYLNGYHAFSDAPSFGGSTTVTGYVYNVIKAATCGGVTCNAMLKAQMLATALDVYFSDPALGGNKIGAPAPIGGVSIDLTKICAMIDGSGGSGTCGGTYENVSSAFGGAASLTVSQMLTYQNTADPAADAGAVWYSQNKGTQVLAKDAFDAINNQVAFAP